MSVLARSVRLVCFGNVLCASLAAWAGEPSPSALKILFEKPLIVGASVSADWKTDSPGKRLSLRYTSEANIRRVARAGEPGVVVEPSIDDAAVRDRTIVVGIDLFFWDSTRRSAVPSTEALHRVMARLSQLQIPFVLGNIPSLLGVIQLSRNALNREIVKACKAYSKCHLFDADRLYRQIQQDGGLTFQGKTYTVRELIPDGLHLSTVASEYLADQILESLSAET